MNRKLWPLFCVVFLDHLAINTPFMVYAIFNIDSHLFASHISYSARSYWYGISLALMNIVSIIAAPILGYLSDSLGRKRLLIFATIGTALAGVFCASGILSAMILFFLIGRVFSGICTRTEPFAIAAIADLNTDNHAIVQFGYLQFLIAVSAVLGPFIGGYLTTFHFDKLNYAAPYIFASILGFIALVIAMVGFKETRVLPKYTQQPKIAQIFFSLQARHLFWMLFVTQFAWSMYYQFIQVILKQQYDFIPTHLGYFMSILALWIALMSGLAIKPLRNFFDNQRLLHLGMLALLFGCVVTFVCVFFGLSVWLIWFAAVFIAAGNLLAYCTLLTGLSKICPKSQGKIMGISYSVTLATWALSGIIGGAILPIKIYLPILVAILPLLINYGVRPGVSPVD